MIPTTPGLGRHSSLGVMQPYFFPYIGYFQLIAAVDQFIIYDNIKYTKKGWINRNRLLQDGKDVLFSLPLKAGSDSLDIVERELATDFKPEKLLRQFRNAYGRAPFFAQTMPLVERIVLHDDQNLFNFLHHGLIATCQHLGITTPIHVSSAVNIDHELKSQDKVIALCKAMGASRYINAIGGMDLYSGSVFKEHGIALNFIRTAAFEYAQYGAPFVPSLSIVDVMMFNSLENIRQQVGQGYDLI